MAKFFGWLLIVVGVLIAGTAGLCSAGMLASTTPGYSGGDMLPLVAIFGGVPFVFGVVCVIAGWVLRKDRKPKA